MQKAKAKITAEINKIDTQIMYETEPYDSAMKRLEELQEKSECLHKVSDKKVRWKQKLRKAKA